MPNPGRNYGQFWLLSALDYGFGISSALANNLLAILCALSWYAVPRGGNSNPAGEVLIGLICLSWGLSIVDLFRPHTWRYWVRIALVPIGAIFNFMPFFVYYGLANAITSRLGNGPA